MDSSRPIDGQDGALPTSFVSPQQAEALCSMLTLTAAQTTQVSGAGPTSTTLTNLFAVRKICLIRTCFPVICYPIDLQKGALNDRVSQAISIYDELAKRAAAEADQME